LGFVNANQSNESIEIERELWFGLTDAERTQRFGGTIREIMPPSKSSVDNMYPTNLFIVKDQILFDKAYVYTIQFISEFLAPTANNWWNNSVDVLPTKRQRFTKYTYSDPFYVDYL
jgi:hypothetical protein